MKFRTGYYGTYKHAVDFILSSACDCAPGEVEEFLKAWNEGDLEEWPDYIEWLEKQPHEWYVGHIENGVVHLENPYNDKITRTLRFDFSNEPTTLGEIRAKRSHEMKDWSPRDVLIELLRKIDNGEEDPHTLVVVRRGKNPTTDKDETIYTQAGDSAVVTLGMMEQCKHGMMNGD